MPWSAPDRMGLPKGCRSGPGGVAGTGPELDTQWQTYRKYIFLLTLVASPEAARPSPRPPEWLRLSFAVCRFS